MTSALDNIPVTQIPPPAHYGVPGVAGVTATRFDPAGLATLAAKRGQALALADAVSRTFGVELVDGARAVSAGGLTFIGTAPGRWLVLSQVSTDLTERLRAALGAFAAITEQSDSHVGFTLTGAKVRDLMARGPAVDLDPSVFPVGTAATSLFSHVGVTFWQSDAAPTYQILIARTYEAAFTRVLVASGAPYGLTLTGRG